jgi:hypothetical protein
MRLSPISPVHAGRLVLLMALTTLSLPSSRATADPALEWIRQFGTFGGDGDTVSGLSLDGLGSIYLSFNLVGTNPPYGDPYMAKYGEDGNQIWQRQLVGSGVSADALGNVFTRGVGNYDANGNELWSRQPGGTGISADGAGHVYAVTTLGRPLPSDDGLLRKFDAAGNELWSRQFGTSDHEQQLLVSADGGGNVFTFGQRVLSTTNTYTPSATLTKFDADGNEYWTRTLESARYVNRGGVATDGLGNVYITGNSNAPLVEPRLHLGYDAFVAKYDADGNRLWLQEFGSPAHDDSSGVAVDMLGNVYVVGNTQGDLGGLNLGEADAYLAKFDSNGNELWVHQFGTTSRDLPDVVRTDGLGSVYVAGQTRGDLGGPNAGGGGDDAFLAKFNVNVPEPSTGLLLLIMTGMGLASRRVRMERVRLRRAERAG